LLLFTAAVSALALGPPLAARMFGPWVDSSLRPPPGRAVSIGEGLQLNVVETGAGEPIVLVHGLPSCAADWAALPEALARRGYRVIAYDRVGYGHSSRAEDVRGRYTLASNAADLQALLDALQLERATLVGWSYGGGVVQTLATREKGRVAHVVLVASVGPAQPQQGFDPLNLLLTLPVGAEAVLDWIASVPPLAQWMTRANVVEAFAGTDAVPDGWTEYTRAMLSMPRTTRSFVLEWQREGYAQLRPEVITQPTLIFQGERDPSVPPAVAEDLRWRIPNAELVTVPGAGHMLPVTHPELLAEHIDEFVRAHAR
jgi:non-heme chloroperoxidase